MSKQAKLTGGQELRRIEGLRVLARIIARHYLAHPELYPSPAGEAAPPAVNSPDAGDGKGDGHGA